MKLLVDLFSRLFTRTVILLIVASVLIVMEARKQNQDNIQVEKNKIVAAIEKIDKRINDQNKKLEVKGKAKTKLGTEITSTTSKINKVNRTLEKNKKAKLKDKLPVWKVAENLHSLLILNISRYELAEQYSMAMFSIVDLNREIAKDTIVKTRLNGELINIQNKSLAEYLLRHGSPTDLLTPSDRVLLLVLFYGFFFGPLTVKTLNYFVFAPLARRAPPIIINAVDGAEHDRIRYDAPHNEFSLQLREGDSLVVRPGWYSLNTNGDTRTRFFWKLSDPFASYAMGLVNMIEFKQGDDKARVIKIGCEDDPNQSILPIHLDDHPGYVVRQGHVIATSGNELHMKKQWRILDWKSWLFGNIRYVYFTGTGTLYISGYGQVSANDSTTDSRIKEKHVIGFDTRTPVKMLRTETFANYWLNRKPLYDIHFPEQGRYLQQQAYGQRDDKVFRSLLEDVTGAVAKLLGF